MEGYKTHIFHRDSRSVQGGGTIILIKDIYDKYVSVIDSLYDMIIWFKIDKSLCVYKCDVYCAFTYLPPANSVFLKNLNCDIFSELENFLCNYLNQGDVFVFGDFNSRTQSLPDFIENDSLHNDILDSLPTYTADSKLPVRMNPDTGRNEYGTKRLLLCNTLNVNVPHGKWNTSDRAQNLLSKINTD